MKEHRQNILELVATGRLTPADAERLWSVWIEAKVSDWMAVAAVGMGLLATLHAWLAHPAAAGTLRVIHRFWGGLL
ncbi:MAG: hypothetical protein WA294_02050 [Acidobacteriaceae bacterium]